MTETEKGERSGTRVMRKMERFWERKKKGDKRDTKRFINKGYRKDQQINDLLPPYNR